MSARASTYATDVARGRQHAVDLIAVAPAGLAHYQFPTPGCRRDPAPRRAAAHRRCQRVRAARPAGVPLPGRVRRGEAAGTSGTERVGGLLATGDVGRLDADGLLHLSGRADDMVVSGGENVFPREVEDLLAGEPEIAEVAVTGVADEEYGQRLAAYIVLRPGAALTSDEVRARVKGRLARFSVPRDVVFLAELPRNATGKVVPRELPTVA